MRLIDLAYRFHLPIDDFNDGALPPGSPSKGSEDYSNAVHAYLTRQFDGFEGDAEIVVTEDDISVEWEPRSKDQSPIKAALDKLSVGDLEPAIVMLEFLSHTEPENTQVLYNLGMAYSDTGRIEDAIRVLSEAVEVDPTHVNSRTALGVALARSGQFETALEQLERAADDDPSDPWAHRNLAAVLVQLDRGTESIKHFRWAIESNPDDQQAHLGLANVLRNNGELSEAESEFLRVVEIDATTPFANLSRTALSEIAEEHFHKKAVTDIRQDAVLYCVAALEKFDGMEEEEVRKIVYEIAILGTKGLDINDSTQKYTLRSLPGYFSGTHLLSYLYVGFKIISPDQDYPFDLSKEYAVALKVFEERKGKNKGIN